MEMPAELARFNPDPALAAWVTAQLAQAQIHADEVARQVAELGRQAAEFHHKDLKIEPDPLSWTVFPRN